ncbi:MAG: hypothetical protein KME19_17540 [Microcoleus vaginatus WJT46-NPBG5]|nr:hypothetical protein [Microcoleus vaginatus WJT46-NPBG5]
MQFTLSVSPKKITKILTSIVIFFTVAGVAVQVAKYGFNYREDWLKLFNLDKELNYPAWYASFTLIFCSLLLTTIASAKKIEGDRYFRHWKALSIIFLIFSLDEAISIHEILIIPDLRRFLNLGGIFYYVWVIPAIVFVGLVGLAYYKFIKHLPKQTMILFLLAGGLYIGGALGMEMIGGYYTDFYGKNNLTYALITCLEEVLEMAGIVVFIYGLLDYMRLYLKNLDVQVEFMEERKQPVRKSSVHPDMRSNNNH